MYIQLHECKYGNITDGEKRHYMLRLYISSQITDLDFSFLRNTYVNFYHFREKLAYFRTLCEQYQPSLKRDPSYSDVST